MNYKDAVKLSLEMNAEYERKRLRNEVRQSLISACIHIAVTNQSNANIALLTGLLNERN